MNRFFLFLVVLLGTCHSICSQDRMILKDNVVIECKVEKVGIEVVTYKRYDNLNGPIYEELKQNVVAILYENGTAETFDGKSVSDRGVEKNMSKGVQCYDELDKVSLIDGELKYKEGMKSYLSNEQTYNLMTCFNKSQANAYRRFCRINRAGTILMGVGSIASLCGTACLLVNNEEYNGFDVVGFSFLSVGIPSLLTGIPLDVIGWKNKKRKVTEFYNDNTRTSNLNATSLSISYKFNGIAFGYTF